MVVVKTRDQRPAAALQHIPGRRQTTTDGGDPSVAHEQIAVRPAFDLDIADQQLRFSHPPAAPESPGRHTRTGRRRSIPPAPV